MELKQKLLRKMMSKRGVSAVVESVMLILITISLAGIIAGVVIPFVKNSLSSGSACLSYKTYFQFEGSSIYNCNEKENYGVSVKNNGDSSLEENVAGFKLVLGKAGYSKGIDVKAGESVGVIKMLDKTKTIISIPKSGEYMTFVYNDLDKQGYEYAEVYPILKSGKLCEANDKIKFISCTKTGAKLE